MDEKIKITSVSASIDRTKIDKREVWLLDNQAALESLRRGIEQAERGEVYDLGSFVEFADDEID